MSNRGTSGWAMLALLVAASALAGAASRQRGEQIIAPPARQPVIEAVFVLDTTGSMSGLIEGAKRKIWSIANQMASGQPAPRIRVGLVGYRDRGDGYVTRRFELTEDLDAVYGELMEFQAAGGGDTPESVNQALHEAVNGMAWTAGSHVYRSVFLVGDAPPHTDYRDDVPWAQTIALARQRGIVVNTVQCGDLPETREVWQRMATLGAGAYAAVAQDGGMRAMSTPMDAELARLNAALADTALVFGSAERKDELERKLARARRAPASVASSRLSYLAKAGEPAINSGRRDLVGALDAGEVALDEIQASDLPAELRELEPAQREALVAARKAERDALQERVSALVAEREAWLRARSASQGPDAFDRKVLEMLDAQTRHLGLSYGASVELPVRGSE